MSKSASVILGVALCALIAVVATLLASVTPFGGAMLAILIGMAAGNLLHPPQSLSPGVRFCEKHVLAVAIALMGARLDYATLRDLGAPAAITLLSTMAVALGAGVIISKRANIPGKLALLLGVGNAVCGSSAIAASEEIIGAKREHVGVSVAVVNFLGAVGMFVLPLLSHLVLRFSDQQGGLLVGSTLQAVGQVVAAGFSLGDAAGQTATVVKMARILMLTPILLTLLVVFRSKGGAFRLRNIPLFIVGFIALSIVSTQGWLSPQVTGVLHTVSKYALTTAMAAIGLRLSFRSIVTEGRTALLYGAVIFALQIVVATVLTAVLLT